MKSVLIGQKKERDDLLARIYQQRRMRFTKQELLASPLVKFISGPRRVGKSTQALLMLKDRNFAYLNFDDDELLSGWDEELVMRLLDDVYPGYEYMLLDEVQNLRHWDLWVSKLYRRGKNLIVTGSNANMLSSEMATVLTGRYLQIEMMPFSLAETLAWKGIDINNIKEEQRIETRAVVDDYLREGGYPETVLSRAMTRSYLSTLYDAMLWKDVAKRHRVRNAADLNNLSAYLLSNFCNPLSANGVVSDLGLSSVATAKKFMDYLREPYLFFFLPRYNKKLKLMKNAPQKVYVVDNGFVSAKAFSLSDNLGRLLENQVFVELLRRGYDTDKSLFYYRSRNDKETDFVVREGSHVKELIQVCYDMTNAKTEKREVDSIVECAGELGCDKLTIVTNDEMRVIDKDGYLINVVPVTVFFAD